MKERLPSSRWVGALATIAALVIPCGACNDEPVSVSDVDAVNIVPMELGAGDPILPLPTDPPNLDSRKVALGERLFSDPIVSLNGDIACITCHQLSRGGVDGRAFSTLPGNKPPPFHTPTVFNLVYNFRCHWEGSFGELTDQLAAPVQSPRILGTTFEGIVQRLSKSVEYRDAFDEIFDDGLTVDTLKASFVEFERSLVTPNARFDRYLYGDTQALTPNELTGYRLFESYGCVSCHQGINIGGNMYQRLGVMRDYFGEKAVLTEADNGRYNITHLEEDRYIFRVPSLRNVAVTAPYLHDGSAKTLEEVIRIMGRYQLGRELDEADVHSIAAFLRTLTGEYKGQILR